MEKDSEGFRNVSERFIKLRRIEKLQRRAGRDRESSEGLGGNKNSRRGILGGAVREGSLGLCLIYFEVKNDYQKSSLLKVYLVRCEYGGGGG